MAIGTVLCNAHKKHLSGNLLTYWRLCAYTCASFMLFMLFMLLLVYLCLLAFLCLFVLLIRLLTFTQAFFIPSVLLLRRLLCLFIVLGFYLSVFMFIWAYLCFFVLVKSFREKIKILDSLIYITWVQLHSKRCKKVEINRFHIL